MSDVDFFVVAPPANPGASATAVIFDTTYGLLGTPVAGTPGSYRRMPWATRWKRALVTIFADQAVTFLAKTLASGSTTWRTFNGSGSGETAVASTLFERDVYLMGDDWQLSITTGTAPTTWEVSVKFRSDAALAQ